MFPHSSRRDRSTASPSTSHAGGLVGDVARFMITRSVLKRVTRLGGIQGMLLSAAATYAIDRYMNRRR